MRRLTFGLVLGFLAAALAPGKIEAACTPRGEVLIGPGGQYYDHIANGAPTVNDCWSLDPARTTFVSDSSCGYTANAYQFGYAGSLSQTVTIPSDMTQTRWSFEYALDFDDPNNDPAWNRISVTVKDLTTNTILASDSYNGGNPDVLCSVRWKPFTGNLAGHQIRVSFSGSSAYPNTKIKVRKIALYQW
jgi:hypothetical protein